MSRFETEILSSRRNLTALMNLSGMWIDSIQECVPLDKLILERIKWFRVPPPLPQRGQVSRYGEKHDDPGQGLFGAAPGGGQSPPQHFDERRWVGFGVQTQALSSGCPLGLAIGQSLGRMASSEVANGKSYEPEPSSGVVSAFAV